MTIEDFEFTIKPAMGYINMNKIKVTERIMSICGKTNVIVNIPYATLKNITYYDYYIFHHKSLNQTISCNEKQYNEFEKKYKNIDTLQIEVFIIEAKLKNQVIHKLIYQWNRLTIDKLLEKFIGINYNFEPFITGNKQFTNDDKEQLLHKIKEYYYTYI